MKDGGWRWKRHTIQRSDFAFLDCDVVADGAGVGFCVGAIV